MGDWRQMGHAARRRMGAPSNHFGAAMANEDENDEEPGALARNSQLPIGTFDDPPGVYWDDQGKRHTS